MNLETLGITKEEIVELAAQKLADQYRSEEQLGEMLIKKLDTAVKNAVQNNLTLKIDEVLRKHMDAILESEVVPCNIWGEKVGKPTTIKEQLSERAQHYWTTKVDSEGRTSEGYGSKPRCEWLFGKLVATEFSNAVAQNVTNIVGALKDSLTAEAQKSIAEHIDNIIRVKTK